MRGALRKAQRLARRSALSLEREPPKEQPQVLSSAGRSLMSRALRKAQRLVRLSVLPLEWEQAKEQPRVPLLAEPRIKDEA
jgi:hypothetical protein